MLKLKVLFKSTGTAIAAVTKEPTQRPKKLQKKLSATQQISSDGKDNLYEYQMAVKSGPFSPYDLDEYSLLSAGFCQDFIHATWALRKLKYLSILTQEGLVEVSMIKNSLLAEHLTIFDYDQQRRLVHLLYWWDSECARLRQLFMEEAELNQAIVHIEDGGLEIESAANHDNDTREYLDQLRFARERLRMRIRQMPSERNADVESGNTQPLSSEGLNTTESGTAVIQPPAYEHSHGPEPPPYLA